MVGHGWSSASLYLANPTFPIPSHCAVIIRFSQAPGIWIFAMKGMRHLPPKAHGDKSLFSLIQSFHNLYVVNI